MAGKVREMKVIDSLLVQFCTFHFAMNQSWNDMGRMSGKARFKFGWEKS